MHVSAKIATLLAAGQYIANYLRQQLWTLKKGPRRILDFLHSNPCTTPSAFKDIASWQQHIKLTTDWPVLQAMMATAHLHGPAEAATRIIPAVAPLTIDTVTEVRRTALQALSDFSQVLKDHSKLLEDQAATAGEINSSLEVMLVSLLFLQASDLFAPCKMAGKGHLLQQCLQAFFINQGSRFIFWIVSSQEEEDVCILTGLSSNRHCLCDLCSSNV